MLISTIRGLAIFTIASITFPVSAQEPPTSGLLYNTQERHSLTYECEQIRADQVSCEFVQTKVRPKSTSAQLPNALEKARKEFRNDEPSDKQVCETFRELLVILEGKKAAPKSYELSSMSQTEKADALHTAKAFVEYCDNPTEKNFMAIARVEHGRDLRTCSVSSHSYKQMFRKVSEGNGRTVWVVQSSPEGSCGVVQLSRFEPEEVKLGEISFTFWKYVARKAITNPNAELFPGAECSGLDEAPYTYDWRERTHQISCDYIQFSPL